MSNCVGFLRKQATKYLDAISTARKCDNVVSAYFRDFPIACCGAASEMLAQYLRDEQKINEIEYIHVFTPGEFAHAWLKVDEIDIDITFGQLGDGQPDLMVRRNSEFHATLMRRNRASGKPFSWRLHGDKQDVYERIMVYL